MIGIRREQLDRSDDDGFQFYGEASSLGWRPGNWPSRVCAADFRNYEIFDYLEEDHLNGDLLLVRYVAKSGATITIFND